MDTLSEWEKEHIGLSSSGRVKEIFRVLQVGRISLTSGCSMMVYGVTLSNERQSKGMHGVGWCSSQFGWGRSY